LVEAWRAFRAQPLKFLDGHADVGDNPAECSFGNIATLVQGSPSRAISLPIPAGDAALA